MKSISQMTSRELKSYIRDLTTQANKTIKKISNQKKVTPAVQRELDILSAKGYIGKSGRAVTGFRGKDKTALQEQARELRYFSKYKGTERKDKRNRFINYEKYKSFKRNNKDFKDLSFTDWRDLVETFASVSDLMESFGYENIKELYKETDRTNTNVNLVDEMRQLRNDVEGKGMSQEDVIDLLRERLFNQ